MEGKGKLVMGIIEMTSQSDIVCFHIIDWQICIVYLCFNSVGLPNVFNVTSTVLY